MTVAPEEIEDRLSALPATIAVSAGDARALARLDDFHIGGEGRRSQRPRPRLVPSLVAVAIFLVCAVITNLVAVYFAPAYGNALADAPGIGPASARILKASGLTTGDVTAVDDSATSSGHTIRLVGGYADALRTVLFFQVDGRGMVGDPKAYGQSVGDYYPVSDGLTLSDQFGREYGMAGISGGNMLGFDPLAWPASELGARLTLRITGLWEPWLKISGPLVPAVVGTWTLHATLFSQPPSSVVLPPPLVLPGVTYRVTSARASGDTMSIHFSMTGSVVDQASRLKPLEPSDGLWASYFNIRMFDSAGNEVQMSDWGYTFPKAAGSPADGSIDAFISGPGRYGIQFGQFSAPEDIRWIQVR